MHAAHAVLAFLSVSALPAAHALHDLALALDTLPTAHAAHLVLASASSSCLPEGQSVQAVELAAEYWPALQLRQPVDGFLS